MLNQSSEIRSLLNVAARGACWPNGANQCPNEMPTVRDIIGLIPAAGIARRLDNPSQSKEILPVVFGPERAGDAAFAKPACHYLLEGFRSAGVTKALMVLRTGKWDIPASLARNPVQGVELSFIVIEESAGVPWTLDRAYAFVRGSDVVVGFPDILIRPTTMYRQMVEKLWAGSSDVVSAECNPLCRRL